MNVFLLGVLIVGVVAIIGIFVSSHYRNKDGYKRIFANGAPMRRRRMAGESSDSASFAAWAATGSASNSPNYPQSHDTYAPDCSPGHGGGDAGGSCSDGGGGGGADGGGGGH